MRGWGQVTPSRTYAFAVPENRISVATHTASVAGRSLRFIAVLARRRGSAVEVRRASRYRPARARCDRVSGIRVRAGAGALDRLDPGSNRRPRDRQARMTRGRTRAG